jgi:hypothetical protein
MWRKYPAGVSKKFWKDNIKLYLAENTYAIQNLVVLVQDCVHSRLMGFQIPASSATILFYFLFVCRGTLQNSDVLSNTKFLAVQNP